MKEFELKYGCNPNQKPAKIYMADGSELPVKILSGRPGYINFLDAFNGWQLVSNLKKATGLPAATSFKHVSPAGAAVGLPLTETLAKIYWVNDMDWKNFSPLACAYARARGADRMSSFGDFISLSDVCDKDTALLIKREVSDGVIAPGYTEEALEILKQKKKGNYNVIQIDENFVPAPLEHKEVFGVTFEQGRQELEIDDAMLSNIVTENKELTEEAKRDMKISLIILKYTQSNSVCFVKDGQAIGVGAGQLKSKLMIHSLINGICLISVSYDCFVSQYTYRCIDDQTRICKFGRIKRLGTDSLTILYKYSVSAVLASAHDEISCHCFLTVCGTSNYNSSARIGILFQFFFQ